MTRTADETIKELYDLEEIRRLKAEYCRFLDTKQFDSFCDLFTEDCVFEDAFEHRDGVTTRGAHDDFVARAESQLKGIVTVHQCHTPEIDFQNSTTARGVWAMYDYVTLSPDVDDVPGDHLFALPEFQGARGFVGYGYYEEEYTKNKDGDEEKWRISRLRLTRIRVDLLSELPRPVQSGGQRTHTKDWLSAAC